MGQIKASPGVNLDSPEFVKLRALVVIRNDSVIRTDSVFLQGVEHLCVLHPR